MQTQRTKAKIEENANLVIADVERLMGAPAPDDLKMIVWNALNWTADDVQKETLKQIDEQQRINAGVSA